MQTGKRPLTYGELADGLYESRDDVLVTAAALQLTPANQTKWARFVRLVELAHVIGPSNGTTRLSASQWRRLLSHAPIADPLGVSEDPSEEPFVSCVQFFGGSYRVLSGGYAGAHVGCQLVLEATRHMGERGREDFETTVFREAHVLLCLSEAASHRAGLRRYTAPEDPLRPSVLVPPPGNLDGLRRAVVFTPDQCQQLVGADVAAEVESLTLHRRVPPTQGVRESPTDDRLYGLPLGRTQDGDIVLAMPGGVTMSIVHRTLALAVTTGVAEEFVDLLRRAQIDVLDQVLEAMRWEPVGRPDDLDPPSGFHERFYRFDIDKVAHVCSVIDTLAGYESGRPFSLAAIPEIESELRARLSAVRTAFRRVPDRGSVFHVVALAPLGRSCPIRFSEKEIDAGSEVLVASLADVVVMASEAGDDPLGLWAFARARRRLRDRVEVFSFSALDEFAIYKDHGDGFYLGDDLHPTMMTVQSDSATHLRIDVAQRRDAHAAKLPDSDHTVLVERWPASNEQTIYRPVSRAHNAYHLIEIGDPVWVVPADVDGSDQQYTEHVVEAVAFWIWRCGGFVAPALNVMSEFGRLPVIEVSAAVPDPAASSDLEPLGDWLEIVADRAGRIMCRLGEGAGRRFHGPSNEAERVLARELIATLFQVAGLDEPPAEDWPKVVREDSLVKMLHVLGPSADPVLALGPDAEPRLIQPSAVEVVSDQLGEPASDSGVSIGLVEESSRTSILNAAVAWAFNELRSLLQSLHPAGLLEALALETESIIYVERRAKLQAPSQAACFGAESAAVSRTKSFITGMSSTAIANRFLIEMVTASPSTGRERFSLETYDRLIALASQIVELGFLSDAIRFGLSNERIFLLPSGRLGFGRSDAYQVAFARFGELVSAKAMNTAVSTYPSNWKEKASGGSHDTSDIDCAYAAEFGISATDLSLLVSHLMQHARDCDHGVAVSKLDVLRGSLAEGTGLPDATVGAGLGLLCLESVDDLDPQLIPRDMYPWKFSRDRSMLRRPLLVRPTATGDEVIWGARASWRAWGYLLSQLTSARYRATSNEMKRFIGDITSQAGKEFNRRVAEALRDAGFGDVRERVETIGTCRLRRSNGQTIGDIDVLVIDRPRRVLIAVEAKDFQFARTPQELANEVEKLIGEHNSASIHHLERVDFLRTYLPRLLRELDLTDDPASWDVQGMVVTSADLLGTHYLAASGQARELRLISLDRVREQSAIQLVAARHHKNPAKAEKRQRRKRRKRR